MALILNIDTATEIAGISLAKEGENLLMLQNREQKSHASWVHEAIVQLMGTTGYRVRDLDAVGVMGGPGSYTGLRVGMAAAKGLSYALGIPLIAENTLWVMAYAAIRQGSREGLLCPMIDARRMEVFTAVYGSDGVELLSPRAMVIDENSFENYLSAGKLSFFGGGSHKCKPLLTNPSAVFIEVNYNVGYLGILSFLRYLQKEFTDIVLGNPVYTKEFYTHTKK
jgi:tRNA threonylcarbamoyladenosine biosynthesis protein TsaB